MTHQSHQDGPYSGPFTAGPQTGRLHSTWALDDETTFVGGLRHDAMRAPLVLDDPSCRSRAFSTINGERFLAYVEQFLAPGLNRGDVVIMDNPSAHKVDHVYEAIEAVGATLQYLPPYSPDFNPIEQAFSRMQALLRKAAARTKNALWNPIGNVLLEFTTKDCRSFFKDCGYVHSK